jgi:glycosyltransferase involved in cell wall biosynthesis
MISVVIPAHNAAETLGDCLQAILSSDHAEYEVVVVDDASTDTTARIAEELGCRVVRLPENTGAAQAKNTGARHARGDVLLFTDADIVLQPDTIRLVAEDLADPAIEGAVGLLGQKLRYGNFSSQFKNLWMHYTYKRLAESRDAARGVGVFFTSLAAIRREVFERMGGFDTHYLGASVTEDIEFGQRLLTGGHRIRLDQRLTVEHLKRYTLSSLVRTDVERAFGLTKTWLRKKLEPAQRSGGQRYYASVPWFFVLGVPLAWLLPAQVVFGLCAGQLRWIWLAVFDLAAILLLNAPFLNVLRKAGGWSFGLRSGLFLPVDLWVSGLGVVWATADYMAGKRY